MDSKILVIGSSGQIGTELVLKLREIYGNKNVIASDIRKGNYEVMESGPFEYLDVMNKNEVKEVLEKHEITEVYLMVAILSVIAEQNPLKAWELNMNSLFNILELAKNGYIKRLFWPSSIAVFGPDTPKEMTPQDTVIKPSTVYGISKLAGENWCSYYRNKYGVDVRSIRYPGLISYKTTPGGGTTDYAVEIFYEAIKRKSYTCFLEKDTVLPMMYMDDAINATIGIMQPESLPSYVSYNLGAFSFSPEELAEAIKMKIPQFEISYKPDARQEIAMTWPQSIDDSKARKDWGWEPKVGLEEMVDIMLQGLHFTI
ncbi:NAD-dependent epimerase/dehydratase family protein [Lutimonas zeaxanthinifaciens]|uniref:NAD-dependent epimerase/dehydratase family protein n=1 Tax=Lutimonas zeaxanthinifaciens TaxID=3060215 RepID=UPI00265CDE6B|nr:NAD-dependent epimerase/dehydratase family protein [Lutimonas sp. YSD2104]WKK66591.1 NAD-dependent epimerase/dehydratase family protein [Lutimonas sp. YSD2104]